MAHTSVLDQNADEIYRYMNFNQIEQFSKVADSVQI
jgi:aconitate hydratase 2/2-methylisocitrate dehydratase